MIKHIWIGILSIFLYQNTIAQCKEINEARNLLVDSKANEALTTLQSIATQFTTNQGSLNEKCVSNFYFCNAVAHLQLANYTTKVATQTEHLDQSFTFFQSLYKLPAPNETILKEAESQYEQLAALYVNAGVDYYGEQNFKQSLTLNKKAIAIYESMKKTENISSAKYNATLAALAAQEYPTAIKFLDALIAENFNNNNEVHYRLKAQALIESGNEQEAMKTLSLAMGKFPKDLDLKFQQLNLLMAFQQNDASLTLINDILNYVNDRADLWVIKAQFEIANSAIKQAKNAYENALEIEPNNEYALYGIAVFYINESNDLVDLLDKGMDHNGKKINEADLTEKIKANYQKSAHYLEKVLKVNPVDTSSMEMLAKVYHALGEEEKAMEIEKKIQ